MDGARARIAPHCLSVLSRRSADRFYKSQHHLIPFTSSLILISHPTHPTLLSLTWVVKRLHSASALRKHVQERCLIIISLEGRRSATGFHVRGDLSSRRTLSQPLPEHITWNHQQHWVFVELSSPPENSTFHRRLLASLHLLPASSAPPRRSRRRLRRRLRLHPVALHHHHTTISTFPSLSFPAVQLAPPELPSSSPPMPSPL